MSLTDLRASLADEDIEARHRAVAALSKHSEAGSAEALAVWMLALGDDNWRVRKAAGDALLERLGPSAVGHLIDGLRSPDNAGLRNAASECLVRLGDRSLGELRRHLADPDHDVRKFVVDILGEIGSREAVAALLPVLDDQDENVRAAAAEALGKTEDPSVIDPLWRAAARDGDLLLQLSSLEALVRLGASMPVAELRVFIANRSLARPAYALLGRVRDPSAVAMLVEGLVEPVRSLRSAALGALGVLFRRTRHADAAARSALARPEVRAEVTRNLRAALAREPADNAATAMHLLGLVGDLEGIPAMLAVADDERLHDAVREALMLMGPKAADAVVARLGELDDEKTELASEVLAELGDPRAQSGLLGAARSSDPRVQERALRALGRLGDAQAATSLVTLLLGADSELAPLVAQALADLGAREPTATRTALLASWPREPRAELFVVLGAVGGEADVALVEAALRAREAAVRCEAVRALERTSPGVLGTELAYLLSDESDEVRVAAARALGHARFAAAAPDPELADALGAATRDEHPSVAAAALRSLGALGAERALPVVVAALADPRGEIALAALEAVAALGTIELLAHLDAAAGHPDAEVAKAALDAAVSARRDAALPLLARRLADRRWDVRAAAARALGRVGNEPAREALRARLLQEQDTLVRETIQSMLGS